ncbi:GTP 3',8-cyclase MoaA [Sphingomonas sp. ID0503]|uniref:GTP 3',8-cyclase MoaA n=1 Tax=Sphingomonas sp. ID0503 TaxID=3399691 RepID=UPI003AFA0188
MTARNPLIDGFGRRIDYVRLSVTDRCDLRCRYCMGENMVFAPRRALLTIDEMLVLGRALVARGVRRIRLTGGEPLVRRGVLDLVRGLDGLRGEGLEEVTLTTNGTQLGGMAESLFAGGVRRINVSLDSRDPARFAEITRGGDLAKVLAGIEAAREAGMAIKINMVPLAGINDDEIADMLVWCGAGGMDLSLIEAMPLGEIEDDRYARHLSLGVVKEALAARFTLIPTLYRTGGPARYFEVAETGRRLGFITPLTENFCAGCNRIRIAATGTVYGCLGHDQKVELREVLRSEGGAGIDAALDRLLAGKPLRHDFDIAAKAPAVARHMSVTGG